MELNNLWEVETPLGEGRDILIESKDNDYYWTIVLFDSKALVTFPQNKIKICRHYTLGIKFSDLELKNVIS